MGKAKSFTAVLTWREQEILALLRERLSNREIAEKLSLSVNSVKWHTQQIYNKLGVNNRREAVACFEAGEQVSQLNRDSQSALVDKEKGQSSQSRPNHNLPAPLTSFIGREREFGEVVALLEKNRLVTLTGSGGVGKTRLALYVAENVVDQYSDGVWLVELASISDPGLLAQFIAATLGLYEEGDRPFKETLVDFLRSKQVLIVLDNCEHLSEACARLATQLLHVCPVVTLLASSRELLGVNGEMPYRVPSLNFPGLQEHEMVCGLQEYAAVRLFVERAQVAEPGFQATVQNSSQIAKICQLLDGIPLALELAAARLNVLTVEQLVTRLDDAFHLLTGGSRSGLPRHQTLKATIDWSYQLLTERERLLLRRLAVFAGGWTLEAAEAICSGADDKEGAVQPADVLELLASLVNKSMVIAEHRQNAEIRYRLLETVRQFAIEKLVEAGVHQALSMRHTRFFLQFAETGGIMMWTAERLEWTRWLNADLDNLRAAMQWCYSGKRDIQSGVRIAAAVGRRFLQTMGLIGEARQWLLQGLNAWDPSFDRRVRVSALNAMGWLDFHYAVTEDTLKYFEESVQICRSLGPTAFTELSWALSGQAGTLVSLRGDEALADARRLVDESIRVARHLELPGIHLVFALNTLWDMDKTINARQARQLVEESVQANLETGDHWSGAGAFWRLAEIAATDGNVEHAKDLLFQSLTLFQEANDKTGIALTYYRFAILFRHQGNFSMAVHFAQESLRAWNAMGSREGVSNALGELGSICAYCANRTSSKDKEISMRQAARLLGASEEIAANMRLSIIPYGVNNYQKVQEILHSELDLDVVEKAWAEGKMMTIDEAVNFAFSIQ
jgi:predicted ATPase/DNA-binding CsgD family transcriptional regulator